jgi:hypothetical protein
MPTIRAYPLTALIHAKLYEVLQLRRGIGSEIRNTNTPQIRITLFPQKWHRTEDGRLEILKARIDVLELIIPD